MQIADNHNTENKKIKAYFNSLLIQERVYHVVGRHPKPSVSHPTTQDIAFRMNTRLRANVQ